MQNSTSREFRYDKYRIAFDLFALVVFVAVSIVLLIKIDRHSSGMNFTGSQPNLAQISAAAGILFLVIPAFLIFRKMTDRKPGLVLSNEGVFSNPLVISPQFIPWADISGISEKVVFRRRYMVLSVRNPEEYIWKETNVFSKLFMWLNVKSYNTPFILVLDKFEINARELKALVESKFEEHSRKAAPKSYSRSAEVPQSLADKYGHHR